MCVPVAQRINHPWFSSLLPFTWFVFWLYSLLSDSSLWPATDVSPSKRPCSPFPPFCILTLHCIYWSSSVRPLSLSHQLCVEAPFSPMRESRMNRRAYWEQWKSRSLPVRLVEHIYLSSPLLLTVPSVSEGVLFLKMYFKTDSEGERLHTDRLDFFSMKLQTVQKSQNPKRTVLRVLLQHTYFWLNSLSPFSDIQLNSPTASVEFLLCAWGLAS